MDSDCLGHPIFSLRGLVLTSFPPEALIDPNPFQFLSFVVTLTPGTKLLRSPDLDSVIEPALELGAHLELGKLAQTAEPSVATNTMECCPQGEWNCQGYP